MVITWRDILTEATVGPSEILLAKPEPVLISLDGKEFTSHGLGLTLKEIPVPHASESV
jgi:hypothetical protein